jgi:hypothetical protein
MNKLNKLRLISGSSAIIALGLIVNVNPAQAAQLNGPASINITSLGLSGGGFGGGAFFNSNVVDFSPTDDTTVPTIGVDGTIIYSGESGTVFAGLGGPATIKDLISPFPIVDGAVTPIPIPGFVDFSPGNFDAKFDLTSISRTTTSGTGSGFTVRFDFTGFIVDTLASSPDGLDFDPTPVTLAFLTGQSTLAPSLLSFTDPAPIDAAGNNNGVIDTVGEVNAFNAAFLANINLDSSPSGAPYPNNFTSYSGLMQIPAASVPESSPVSALVGFGLIGSAFALRRKARLS